MDTESKEPVQYTWTNTEMHNARMRLTLEIENLIKPFLHKYDLRPDQVEMTVHPNGAVWMKVKI